MSNPHILIQIDICPAGSGVAQAASVSRMTYGSDPPLRMRRPHCCEEFLLPLRPKLTTDFSSLRPKIRTYNRLLFRPENSRMMRSLLIGLSLVLSTQCALGQDLVQDAVPN